MSGGMVRSVVIAGFAVVYRRQPIGFSDPSSFTGMARSFATAKTRTPVQIPGFCPWMPQKTWPISPRALGS